HFSREKPVGLISSRTGERIPFSSLSPGLQRYLLRTGHFRLLKLENRHDRSVYVFDEPESGLGTPLASSLLDDTLAHAIGPEAQTFVATLDESLVQSFAEREVFRLAFDESVGVRVDRETPVPSTPPEPEEVPPNNQPKPLPPNAVRLARLKREIKESDDQDELADLLDEWMSIRDR
ncbi:MAG: hypothetical protein AAGF67_00935, partial [Verrucomicrobiota bacterium]